MITPSDMPSEPPDTLTDPRELLTGYLDYYRSALLRKLEGFPEDRLRAAVLPSGWTPLELFKHLTYVEVRWLQWGFMAEDVGNPWGDRGPGGRPENPWKVGEDETLDGLKALAAETWERSRQIVASASLDEAAKPGERFQDEPASLIWILFHLLQEYARHLGHLDVVRELADGAVGE